MRTTLRREAHQRLRTTIDPLVNRCASTKPSPSYSARPTSLSAYMPRVTTSQSPASSDRVSAAVTARPRPCPRARGWTAIDFRCPTDAIVVVSAAQASSPPSPTTPTHARTSGEPGCGARRRAGLREQRPYRVVVVQRHDPLLPRLLGRRLGQPAEVPVRAVQPDPGRQQRRGAPRQRHPLPRRELGQQVRHQRRDGRRLTQRAEEALVGMRVDPEPGHRALTQPASGHRVPQRPARERVVIGGEQHLGRRRQRGQCHDRTLAVASRRGTAGRRWPDRRPPRQGGPTRPPDHAARTAPVPGPSGGRGHPASP